MIPLKNNEIYKIVVFGGLTMKCPNCGKENEVGAQFCANCGKKLDQVVSTKNKVLKKNKTKNWIILGITISVLAIVAGFAINHSQSNRSSNPVLKTNRIETSKHRKKKTEIKKLSLLKYTKLADYTPSEAVAIIVWYMQDKEPSWEQITEQNSASVKIRHKRDYNFAESDTVYVLNKVASYSYLPNRRDASDVIVAIYTNGANISIVHKPFSEIIRALRKRNIEQNILKLSKRIKIVDQRETTVAFKSTYPGDKGLFTFPTAMQGKWYYWNEYEKKVADLVVTEHQIGSSKDLSEVHMMDPKFLATYDYSKISSDYKKVAENWSRAATYNEPVHGIKWINIRGYFQTAGDGSYFGLHHEEGRQVLVMAYGAQIATSAVGFRSATLAKKYGDYHFPDLFYLD